MCSSDLGNYWAVPVIEGIEGVPRSDQLKHFGAAMASFGSTALFHIVGLTPEARILSDVASTALPRHRVTKADIEALRKSYLVDEKVDVVVFSAPQLSLYELRDLAAGHVVDHCGVCLTSAPVICPLESFFTLLIATTFGLRMASIVAACPWAFCCCALIKIC